MLMDALDEFRDQLVKCVPDLPHSQGVQVALVSWSYNVEPSVAWSSTLAKYANAGRWRDPCSQLPRWSKAGGRTV